MREFCVCVLGVVYTVGENDKIANRWWPTSQGVARFAGFHGLIIFKNSGAMWCNYCRTVI